ncbi:MAG: glycosyltransferase family 4 protein [candidate division WOR-3 bacterium]|nr:MAG: glycosyltransferase family 4 protein [candidate division WOR-3 bacterium]
MRILAITDCYPPYHFGGFGLRAKELLDRLLERGHDIAVVTTKRPRGEKDPLTPEKDVFRKLSRWDEPAGRKKRILDEIKDVTFVKRKVDWYRPDFVYLLHICDLSKTLIPYLAECGIPVVYDEGTIGMSLSYNNHGYWYPFAEGKPISKLKALLKPTLIASCCAVSGSALKKKWSWPANMRGYFNSEWGRQNAKAEGMPIDGSAVIYSGLDTEMFAFTPRAAVRHPPSIALPGRFEAAKNQREAVRLLAALHQRDIDARLVLSGHVWDPSYLHALEKEIKDLQLAEHVQVLPSMVGYGQLPSIYQQADICFFPSLHKSGLSRVPLEAMASGCAVISYGNEGSAEIIQDRETGYLVPEGDLEAAVRLISELIAHPDTYRSITYNARTAIMTRHLLGPYVDKIETFLLEAVNA